MNNNICHLKRYAISAGVTFLAGFIFALGLSLEGILDTGGAITRDLIVSTLCGASLAGVRALVKYLNELLITKNI